ncbi:VOC family protein [Desulfoferula mesophila]|uniref:Glyoxalase n=1 Tax=Desulfoferula mesophila TaxID=3058419 RepID=A0AAU9EM72_9BACT|nr:glyoxalase [Desulfoferula mesophilus]
MIQIKNYSHTALVVKDLEKCKWFYGKVLGLASINRPKFRFPGEWYQVGNSQLHLMVRDEDIPIGSHHLAFETEDFAEAKRILKQNGIAVVDGPGKREDHSDYLFCRDPDGNLVEITFHVA